MSISSKIFHFLGGIVFALILIGSTALFVIGGTLLESFTKSHQHASYFTYNHPFFKLLLFLFFINILFAALRRAPFKMRHIPFLITHLGLLMIIAGCIVKGYVGKQGSMLILEGASSNFLTFHETHALYIENQKNEKIFTPLEYTIFGNLKKEIKTPFPDLKLEILEFHPHATSELHYWTKDNFLSIAGFPKIPLTTYETEKPLKINKTPLFSLLAYHCSKPYETLKEIFLQIAAIKSYDKVIPLKEYLATLSFDQSACKINFPDHTFLTLTGSNALLNEKELDLVMPKTLVFLKDPSDQEFFFLFNEQGALYSQVFSKNKRELYSFNKGFAGYGLSFSFPSDFFDLSRGRQEQKRGEALLLALEKDSPKTSLLLKDRCLLLDIDPAKALTSWLKERKKSDSWPYSEDTPKEQLELITFLSQKITPLPPLEKWEDNRAKITLKATENGVSSIVSLHYDPFNSGLKWPILQGKYLLRFQPMKAKIPYHLRLRSSRQINYPGTEQPYSFESDLLITHEENKDQPIETTLSMNKTFETKEGYCFYMANISKEDPLMAKRAQFAVNYDPTKYYLTYPGSLFLSLGILLLFWMRPYKKALKHA